MADVIPEPKEIEIVPGTTLPIAIRWGNDRLISAMTGQLSPKSQRVYRTDAKIFARWIEEQGLSIETIERDDMIQYREFLQNSYAKATAARMLSVARRLLEEAMHAKRIAVNPAKGIRGFKLANETPHTALNKAQAREMLQEVDKSTIMGKRNYAILMLLLRTGIRRSECSALRLCDLKQEQGHHIATIEHGKGDKRRTVKLPVDVQRAIDDWMKVSRRKNVAPDAPLFVGLRKDHQPTEKAISDKLIERLVIEYGKKINVDITPHGMRATFITLALEGKASLEQTQYAAGHESPRTTQRYQKRKLNLDDNAVDYIKL